MLVLIWIQTVEYLKEFSEKVNFYKRAADNNKSKKNYPACKYLKLSHLQTLKGFSRDKVHLRLPESESWIEKSVQRLTVWYYEAC